MKYPKRSFTGLFLFWKHMTYIVDDFGNMVAITYDNLGSAGAYVFNGEH